MPCHRGACVNAIPGRPGRPARASDIIRFSQACWDENLVQGLLKLFLFFRGTLVTCSPVPCEKLWRRFGVPPIGPYTRNNLHRFGSISRTMKARPAAK